MRDLASRVPGLAARRVVGDFAAAYGLHPVLAETLVAPEYRGSGFLAAGWRGVGETSGRRLRDGVAEPAKRILLLPLAADWDTCLETRRVLAPGDGLDSAAWAENEFDAAPLGRGRFTFYFTYTGEDERNHHMTEPWPLNPTPTPEVPLGEAPLARVLAQARFPTILAIRDADKVAGFQEALRETYPNLRREQVHSIEIAGDRTPDVRQDLIWRLADQETEPRWQVSLGVNFVALDTSDYNSRADFLARLRDVLTALEQAFNPASTSRFGLRYIDHLTGEAVDRIEELIHTEILGMIQRPQNLDPTLRDSVIHQITETQFLAPNGNRIQGRWGKLPANATYDPNALAPVAEPSWVLDLDMFTTESRPFVCEDLLTTATGFAECLYWFFRQMVTMEFLRFHGGEP